MGEIHKLTKDGKTLFPATTTDAVAHPQTRTALSNLIHEFNVSELFPKTEGYTLESAINILNSKSINITQGTKVMFLDEGNNFQEWVFSGSEPTNTSSWFRLDSWYTETEDYTDDLEANLITDALRKTEQNLSDAEVTQVKKNLKIPEAVVKVTWAELKVLKENSKLVPGQYYRIYNFKTTTGQENTKSANHQFDIIIEALTENELIEEAKVCQHEGDTYFSNTALEAWEIKYCLENDTNRFAWANNSGYGVIYYMKDEFNNEAWYDFKNIMFLRNTDWLNSHKSKYAALSSFSSDTWFYTFSLVKNGNIIDDSLGKVNETTYYASDNHLGRSTASITKLNNTVFISNVSSKGASNSPFGNIIADGHKDNTLGHSSWVNTIGHNFSENIIGDQFQYNRISENFSKNHIAPKFTYNTIESGCVDNRFNGSVNKCNIKQGYSSNNATGNLNSCNFGSGLTWISDMPGMNNIEIIDNTFSGDSNNKVFLFNLSNTEGRSSLGNILSYENYINKLVVFKTNNSYGTIQLDNLLDNIYNLGDFSNSKGGEDAALNPDISTNKNITVLKYTTQGRNATIIQQVDNLKTTQYLYLGGKKYKRVINFINIPGAGISVNGFPNWQEEYFLTTDEVNNILFKTEKTVTNGSYTDNANCYGYFGTLKNLGLNGNVITINSISVYRRSGSDNNADVPVWCRLLRRINKGWEKLAQSETSRKFNEVEQNGELVFKMIMEENITPLSSIDEVAIVFVNNSEADVSSCNGTLGFKALAGKGALTEEISSNSESISVNNTYAPAINVNYQFLYVDDTVLHSDKDETITGNKTFKSIIKANDGILINEKAFISASIDPGELKVLYRDSNDGFIIRTKDDEDNIHRLELLATNGFASHTYTFPEKSGTVILNNDTASVNNLGLVKLDSDYTKTTENTALSLTGAKNLKEEISTEIEAIVNIVNEKESVKKLEKTSEEVITLKPNVYYQSLSRNSENLTIKLETPEKDNIVNEYSIEFFRPTGTITLPSNIIWANDDIPCFGDNYIYQISILNGLGVYSKFKVGESGDNIIAYDKESGNIELLKVAKTDIVINDGTENKTINKGQQKITGLVGKNKEVTLLTKGDVAETYKLIQFPITLEEGISEKAKTIYDWCNYKSELGITNIDLPGKVNNDRTANMNEGLVKVGHVEIDETGSVVFELAASGVEGDIEWSIDYNGTLVLSAVEGSEGVMDTYNDVNNADWMAQNVGFEKVIIKEGVTDIKYMAFGTGYYDSDRIREVSIPNTVTSIGYKAFYDCDGLIRITIPGSVTNFGDNVFENCSGLTDVTINEGVTNIGNSAFYNCTSLTNVTIPASMANISSSAFHGCTELKEVHISDIAAWCNVDFDNSDANPLYYAQNLYLNGKKVTNLVIPDDVTTIKNYAFYDCNGLTSITIGNGVTSVGSCAFIGCSGLTSITIPENVTSIEDQAFAYCTSLTNVTIPESITSIGRLAFRACSSLTSVVIPNSITILEGMFCECTGLTSVTIPDSVTIIGNNEFEDCSSLTSITIPGSVTTLGDYAFSGCTGLTEITCLATTPPRFKNLVFNNVPKSIPLYVPAESVDLYKSATGWKEFTNIQAIID